MRLIVSYDGDDARLESRQPAMPLTRVAGVSSVTRLLADTTGDGRADIVGFANDGAWVFGF